MMIPLPFSVDQVLYFILVFIRIITIIALVPVFNSESLPPQLKVAFGLILSLILLPMIGNTVTEIQSPFTYSLLILLTLKEVLVGLAVGFIASLLFTALQFAGRLVDTEMGFSFVELVDPFTNETVTVWGQLQVILFTIIFLLINGHYFMILAIQRSFEIVPLLGVTLPKGTMTYHLITLTGAVFEVGLKFAAPIYVPLILSEIALGAVARTVPQMNIFFVGMPIKIFLGLTTAALVLPFLTSLFKVTFEKLIQDIWRLLFLLA